MRKFVMIFLIALILTGFVNLESTAIPNPDSCITAMMGYGATYNLYTACVLFNPPGSCSYLEGQVAAWAALVYLYCGIIM